MTTRVKTRAVLAAALIVTVSALSPAALGDIQGQQPRVWTDIKGREITAELLAVEGESVKLKKEGKVYTVPLSQLSETDRQYVRKTKREDGMNSGLVLDNGAPVLAEGDKLEAFQVLVDGKEVPADVAENLYSLGGVAAPPGAAVIHKKSGEKHRAYVFPGGPNRDALIGYWDNQKLMVRNQEGDLLTKTFSERVPYRAREILEGNARKTYYDDRPLTDVEALVFYRVGWVQDRPAFENYLEDPQGDTPPSYPSITGMWEEGPAITHAISQQGAKFTVRTWSARDQGPLTRAEIQGKITTDGGMIAKMTISPAPRGFKPQTWKATLSPDGKTIKGSHAWGRLQRDFTWIRRE